MPVAKEEDSARVTCNWYDLSNVQANFYLNFIPIEAPKGSTPFNAEKVQASERPLFLDDCNRSAFMKPTCSVCILRPLRLTFNVPTNGQEKNIIGHHIECYGNHLLTKIYATGHFSVANNVNYRYQWRGALRSFNEFPCITALKSVLHQKALGVTINWCSYMHQIVCYFRDSVLTIRGVYLLEFNFRNSEGSPELF